MNQLVKEKPKDLKEVFMKAGKVWGETELVHSNSVLEFHRISFKAGFKCSEHHHQFKWNGFFCESGKLLIKVWQKDYNLVDETILNAGEFTTVKPGVYHQFVGLEDGVAFELYWAQFDHNDIQRESVGHKLTFSEKMQEELEPINDDSYTNEAI